MRIGNVLMRIIAISVLAAAAAVVSGCREEEQGRILSYEKGTYLGEPDQKPREGLAQDLRARAQHQSF